jgi:hypothetical protein
MIPFFFQNFKLHFEKLRSNQLMTELESLKKQMVSLLYLFSFLFAFNCFFFLFKI